LSIILKYDIEKSMKNMKILQIYGVRLIDEVRNPELEQLGRDSSPQINNIIIIKVESRARRARTRFHSYNK